LGIPKLDALNPATLTRKVDYAGSAANRDSASNLDFVVGAVLEMHNYTLELNGSAGDFKPQSPVTFVGVDGDRVAISPTVNIRPSERFPSVITPATALRVRCNTQTKQQEQQAGYPDQFISSHLFSFEN